MSRSREYMAAVIENARMAVVEATLEWVEAEENVMADADMRSEYDRSIEDYYDNVIAAVQMYKAIQS